MTRDQVDVLWQRALHESVKDGEQFTRYHFAALVAAAEREKVKEQGEAERKLAIAREALIAVRDADENAQAMAVEALEQIAAAERKP